MTNLKVTKKDWIYLSIVFVLVIVSIVMSVLYVKKPTSQYDNMSYYDKKCASYAVQNANLAQGQIVFIGDSITDLYHLDDYYSDLSLATYNRGISGDITSGVLDRLQVSVIDLHPSKVVLMIGINDINGGRSAESIISNYNSILDTIKTNLPTTEVYCMSILPMHRALNYALPCDVSVRNQQIMSINSSLQSVVSAHGYEYVDLFSLVVDDNNCLIESLSDDGIHLNHNGFVIWTNVMKVKLSNGE